MFLSCWFFSFHFTHFIFHTLKLKHIIDSEDLVTVIPSPQLMAMAPSLPLDHDSFSTASVHMKLFLWYFQSIFFNSGGDLLFFFCAMVVLTTTTTTTTSVGKRGPNWTFWKRQTGVVFYPNHTRRGQTGLLYQVLWLIHRLSETQPVHHVPTMISSVFNNVWLLECCLKQIPIKVRGVAVSAPVWVVQPNIDMRICMFDHFYQDMIIVQSRLVPQLHIYFIFPTCFSSMFK